MKDVNTFAEYLADEERVSKEDLEAIRLEKELILKLVEARESMGLSQRDLAAMTGLKQPAIARYESLRSTPRLDTLLKVLIPLGYTLSIVPIKE